MGILESLESSGFAVWVRESPSLLAYQLYITLHTIGLAMVVGMSSAVSFRILGVASDLPLAPLERYVRFMWLGFWINALSGVVLFVLEPFKFLALPVFYIKMLAVGVAIVAVRKIAVQVLRGAAAARGFEPAAARRLAVVVLASWAVAIVAGRVSAYSTYIQLQATAAVIVTGTILAVGGAVLSRRVGLAERTAGSARSIA